MHVVFASTPCSVAKVDSVETDGNERKYYIFGEKYNKNMKYSALQSICTIRGMLGGMRKGRRVNFIYSYDKRLYTYRRNVQHFHSVILCYGFHNAVSTQRCMRDNGKDLK